ncbi:MAG: recombination mediator RecR [Bacteroidota bacterium]
MNLSSKLIEEAVNAFASLPGIGKKTALRLALHLLHESEEDVTQFCAALSKMKKEIKFCKHCHNIADTEICSICSDKARNEKLICIVEGIKDVMAIENTNQYRGTYHVLGGVISPLEGIGPEQLNIDSLIKRVQTQETQEIIMAISPTIEGDTTIFYLSKQLRDHNVKISTLARGISFGGELEYADELTLGRSIAARRPYSQDFGNGSS